MLITHDRALAKRCDRVVSLADGRATNGRVAIAATKRRSAAS
jgi:predicted ABC-type transport system involved in lysophospholipase L1 biosynthesis ATPase subunit